MGTMYTPPIDLYDSVDDRREPADEAARDDREIGFVLMTHPADNGDLDEAAMAAGDDRWRSVLGW